MGIFLTESGIFLHIAAFTLHLITQNKKNYDA